jgi:DNA-binding CsgD family transcriptional regulator
MVLGWEALQRSDRAAYKLLEETIALARELGDDWCLAGALEGLGFMHLRVGDAPEARRLLTEALAVGRRSGDQFRIRWVSMWLGATAVVCGDLAEAKSILDEGIAGLRRARDKVFLAGALGYLGMTLICLGEYESARECIEESLTLGRETESFTYGISLAFLALTAQAEGNLKLARELAEEAHTKSLYKYLLWGLVPYSLGCAELAGGAHAAARAHLEEAVAASRDAEDSWTLGMSLAAYGRMHLAEGDHKRAESVLHEALEVQKPTGAKICIVDSLEALSAVAVAVGSHTEAARLYAAAASLRIATGYVRFPSEREAYEANLTIAREGLGTEAFEAAWSEGTAMSMDEAIAYAKRGRGERKRPSAGWDSLTPAELDVVKFVGGGLTNPQIGERLFISKRTVQTHLYRIFAKLAISSRAELAAEAARRETTAAK